MSAFTFNTGDFFDLSDEILSITTLDGTFIKINPAFEKVLGYTMEGLKNKNITSYIHPDDLERTRQKLDLSFSSEETLLLENRFIHKNGSYSWIYWYKLKIKDNIVMAIGKDITLQKSEEKLLASFDTKWKTQTGLLNSILNTIPEYICLLNDKFEFVYLNTTAAMRMGNTQEAFIGKTLDDFPFNYPDIDKYKKELEFAMATGKPVTKHLSMQVHGHQKDLEYFIIPIHNKGASIGAVYIARDVTLSFLTQKKLENSQHKLKKIIDLVPYPIFLKDNNCRYTLCNQAQADLFHITIESIHGKTDEEFIVDVKEIEEIKYTDKRILEDQVSIVLPEQIITDKEGKTKILHTTKIPFFNDIDNTINILGISIDITGVKKSEEDLKRTNFELDSFVYKSSHDLRAPLRSLVGLINLARREKDPDMLNEILDRSSKSISKLDSFISDLTNFSRNSRIEIEKEKINFETIIKDCIENLKFMEQAVRIKININLKIDQEFYSDANRMSILFMNLLSNALKYHDLSRPSPFISISVHTNAKGAEIIIEDNGIGIAEEFHSKIFEMFFRASEKSFGSGLGLYIVKQVIEKLSGKISLVSTPGKGTIFKVLLPNV